MRFLLDVLFEQVPGKVAQAQLALARADVEQVDGVEDLCLRDVDVDRAEVFREAVPNEDAAEVEEQPELLVGDFQGDEVVVGAVEIEVAFMDARPFGEVVYDWFNGGDVVVDERETLVDTGAAEDGDPSKAKTCWANNLAITICFNFNLFLLQGDKFRVDGDV